MDRHQNNNPAAPIDPTPHFMAINHSLDDLKRRLDKVIESLTVKAPRQKFVTLDTNPQSYDDYSGYKYFGIFVGAAQSINVTVGGITASVNLIAGYNDLPAFPGTTIAAPSGSFQAVFIWTDLTL